MRISFILVALLLAGVTNAEEYPSFTIPKALLKYANAVVRKHETVVEIHSEKKYTIKEHYVITILNEAGYRYSYWIEQYGKLSSIDRVDGNLYNAMGAKIRSLKKSDITDRPVPGAASGAMVSDSRYKVHDFAYKEYPYTIEYETSVTHDETMFLPNWSPMFGRSLAVEQSSFTVVTSPEYGYRTKEFNYAGKSVKASSGKKQSETWAVQQLSAVPDEYGAPPIHEIAPYLALKATSFRLGNYKGDMSTWQDFGKFIQTLIAGHDELPDTEKKKVAEIVAVCKTPMEKVTALYRYMQSKTHYIGIQLGVGGWVPFSATYVSTKGYGDCKALTNYMVALLKEAGIPAYYSLITAGADAREIDADFPASYFNHIICAVPLQKDTVWLECTSQTKAPGYMGSFTGNRYALMITEQGGVLARTPNYTKNENSYSSSIKATLDTEGQLQIQAKNLYQATLGDNLHHFIHEYSDEEKLKSLQSSIDLPQFHVQSFSYKETIAKNPTIEEVLVIQASRYAQFTGKRLFIVPNLLNKWDNKLAVDTNRIYDIVLNNERVERDTVEITIPDGYAIERSSANTDLTTPFGTYKIEARLEVNKLIYIRKLELSKGKFPASSYAALQQFYEKIYNADRMKWVLVKNG